MTGSPEKRRWRFYRESSGDLPVAREEMLALGQDAVTALTESMMRYRNGTCRSNEVGSLRGGLLELRVQLGHDPYRLLFFQDGPVNLAVLAIYKNQTKTPKKDLDKALKRMANWKARARKNQS